MDLNALTLYKEKISSYVDQNVLDISTTSNILSMFKIKSYTGNGVEPHGKENCSFALEPHLLIL